ncbi:MAG: hypothetical protein AB7I44_19725 [Hyphomicrobiaceae bacterium]|nr:hypothetical protein [Nitrospirales bacterium]
MIYTVFSTTDNPYMNWQSRLLEFSWAEVNQPGELIRLVATSERNHLPASQQAKVIPTWPWDTHPITGDRYLIYNKPASLSQWLTTHKPEGTVLFIDPDCVFRSPIVTEVTPGYSLSQKWIDFRSDRTYYSTDDGSPVNLIQRFCKHNPELIQGVMIPTLIHTDDLRRLVTRWLEVTGQIRQGIRNREGQPLWESDMFGFVIAAAECGLLQKPADLGICTNWLPADVPNAPIIHYCQSILSKTDEPLWDKKSYKPWERVVDPQQAKCDYGRDLLALLNRFIENREYKALQS